MCVTVALPAPPAERGAYRRTHMRAGISRAGVGGRIRTSTEHIPDLRCPHCAPLAPCAEPPEPESIMHVLLVHVLPACSPSSDRRVASGPMHALHVVPACMVYPLITPLCMVRRDLHTGPMTVMAATSSFGSPCVLLISLSALAESQTCPCPPRPESTRAPHRRGLPRPRRRRDQRRRAPR